MGLQREPNRARTVHRRKARVAMSVTIGAAVAVIGVAVAASAQAGQTSAPAPAGPSSAPEPTPVVTGQDSEVESVKSIMAGEQYSTINKDTRKLVEHAITMVKDLQAGKELEINDKDSYNNGVKTVPAYLLEPVIVTAANVKTAYVDDPVLGPITK